ncbi:MAG TPA: hypothetical protein VMR66_04695 [Gemmatimonadota bacterium]|nr:hypothetical protein [Gemmatimonadota bacterium]
MSSPLALLAIGAGLASGASAIVWVRARRRSPWGTAMVVAVVPLCLYAALAVATMRATYADSGSWDTARLTPSVALARGHDVYSTRTEGAVQPTMYPPGWVVSYLPAAAGATPSRVLRIGLVLTLLFAFLPVAALLVELSPRRDLGVVGAASFLLASTWLDSLSYSLFRPHADAPALGYAMLACWLALRPGPATTRWAALVALLCWLSVLSKQVMFPILVVLPLWLLAAQGRRACLRLAGWLAVTGVGAAALAVAFFRPEGVLFNVLTIPARVPWRADDPRLLSILRVLAELVVHALPLVLLVAACAVVSVALRSHEPATRAGPRAFLTGNPWALLAGVALAMVPVSVLGRIKVGGSINTLSPTTYFLLAAAVLAAIEVVRRARDAGPRVHQVALGTAALCAAILAAGGTARIALERDTPVRAHQSQRAYEYLIGEDPRAFFPLHPLAHLLADGTLFHFGSSLYDREALARLPLPATQRESHLPADPSIVCWDQGYWGKSWLEENYFRNYSRRIESGSLRPWDCYRL